MKPLLKKHLRRLRLIKRSERHPLIHKIHKKHKISKRTLFYIKEYGPHSHVTKTIFKESIKILLLASVISSFGGLAIEYIKAIFISIIPIIILMPTLNDMVGDYGTIVSSKFSTLLYENKVNSKWWKSKELRDLFFQILIISIITGIFSSIAALVISKFGNYQNGFLLAAKILTIVILDVLLLVGLIFLVCILAGFYFYKKKEDPNNFLIPITTSIADFGNMILLAALVLAFF